VCSSDLSSITQTCRPGVLAFGKAEPFSQTRYRFP